MTRRILKQPILVVGESEMEISSSSRQERIMEATRLVGVFQAQACKTPGGCSAGLGGRTEGNQHVFYPTCDNPKCVMPWVEINYGELKKSD